MVYYDLKGITSDENNLNQFNLTFESKYFTNVATIDIGKVVRELKFTIDGLEDYEVRVVGPGVSE
jgi:hypothetical protein